MAHLVGDLAKYFQLDDVNIDNWHFKLYYKGCVILFFAGSMVGVLSQYFGDPINCDFTTIDSDVASDYCWIHGSSYIPPEYQPHMKCIVDLDGVLSEDDAPDTSYYQWVVFMQVFQAGMFLFPYKLWCHFEGGLIESFGKDGKSAIMLTADAKKDHDSEGIVMEVVAEKFVAFFKSILHHNQWYFAKYLFCEFLNFAFLFINFWATDRFLHGKFRYYGIEAIHFSMLTRAEQRVSISPFCAIFPTEVSCTVPNIGAAGGEQNHNGMCILTQNIINEKIYLAIWFYLAFVLLVSFFYMTFRLFTLFFDQLRFMMLYSKVRNDYDQDLRKSLEYVMAKCYLGDWFVLHQLSKNVNIYFFRCFIKELRNELKNRPKRSRAVRKADGIEDGKSFTGTLRSDEKNSLMMDKFTSS
eukprot:maker-scaffold106_size358372-snap-gene-0.15 protein:Tk03530 transcript:maker-scaffold106_size358372-snap-gene-0.15-mRNA-1 annotation:"innexin inx2"